MNSKKLGFGLMRLPLTDPADVTQVDCAALSRMADAFLGSGFTYFDTAAPYHNGKSETAFRACVTQRYPREAYTVTDKLSLFGSLKTAEDLPGFFDGQLERCGVDYLDYYLIHALDKDLYAKAEGMGAFQFVAWKKAEGKIKHVGFSFHDKADVLDQILTGHPEMEYVQLQLNYIDWEDPEVQSRQCCEICVKHGKPVIVMEPVKGGLLAEVPEEVESLMRAAHPDWSPASWAIRFAASLPNVVMVLSGMSDETQMADNLSYMKDFQPLTQEETALVLHGAELIRARESIPCTACRYCVAGCPKQIPIPDHFKRMNSISKFGARQVPRARSGYAHAVKGGAGKASDCVACGQCEERCPQHLPIIQLLRDTAATLE